MYINGKATVKNTYEAIVVGSGIDGGWAAKELFEKGHKILVLKRDHMVERFKDYTMETIIPKTNSLSGARGTNIGEYVILIFKDSLPLEGNVFFLDGINELDARACKTYSSSFNDSEAPQKLQLLETLEVQSKTYYLGMEDAEEVSVNYFNLFKNLTLAGYFSSQIGIIQSRLSNTSLKVRSLYYYNQGDKPWTT